MNQFQSLVNEIAAITLRNLPISVILTVVIILITNAKTKDATNWKSKEALRRKCLYVYLTMILSITLFLRSYQPNPFKEIVGKWFLRYRSGFWHHSNIENILLFIPLCPLVFVNLYKKHGLIGVLWRGIVLSVGTTLLIEVTQAIFHRGTFQLSDLFFNTIGGVIGLLIYMVTKAIKQKRKYPTT